MNPQSMATGARDPLAELLPALTEQEAAVESNRCLYCYDAPCMRACPTHIDIPQFIKRIATGDLLGSAKTILKENLLGATCARVCPVQELCEGACVLQAEHRPISIGRLQRHAMDSSAEKAFANHRQSTLTGKSVAIIGAGPAGLSCAGELARLGHKPTIYEKRPLPGGLSTYGIIGLREPTDVALAEVESIARLGVEIALGEELGVSKTPATLWAEHEAIFVGVGLGNTPILGIEGEEQLLDGLEYIEASKLSRDKLKVGRRVLVIGAGNTAIDCATVAKRLGAESVTIVYRRTEEQMSAYPHEVEFIKSEGVGFKFLSQPVRVWAEGSQIVGLECVRVEPGPGLGAPIPIPSSEFVIEADQIVKAIGQTKPSVASLLGLELSEGWIKVSEDYETSVPNVFAGGDCIRAKGAASTVMAVQDGKLAARAIHRRLMGGES